MLLSYKALAEAVLVKNNYFGVVPNQPNQPISTEIHQGLFTARPDPLSP